MKREPVIEMLNAVLALLFFYAGFSKLFDMHSFRSGMRTQASAGWINEMLAAVLPYAEVVIAAGLGFRYTRRIALFSYLFLMTCFCVYTGLIVAGFFTHRPCGCGGIINGMSWEWHFIFNLFFLFLAAVTIYLDHTTKIFMHKQGVS